mmetsp:Transcript_64126/g.119243  ORF Transcript_64126/g.119243 Transcript_64126/m.119243 type:complete len:432 (+) Transcript_64126:64-1359(+)
MRHWWNQVVTFLVALECTRQVCGHERNCSAAAAHPCLRYCFPHLLQHRWLGLQSEANELGSSAHLAEPVEACNCSAAAEHYQTFVDACRPLQNGAVRVFERGDHGNDTCYRIPAITKTVRGTLLAFAEVRHHDCADDHKVEIALSRSVDNGKTWSAAQFIVGDKDHTVGNPWPIATLAGRVVLPYVKDVLGSHLGSGNGVIYSDDDGVTWSTEQDITSQLGPAKTAHPGPNAGLELTLPGGAHRLLVAAHLDNMRGVLIYYSDDGGHTWTTVPEEHTPFVNLTEPGVADLGNGELLLEMRHYKEPTKGKGISRSMDYGMTWSAVQYDADLVGPICQGSIAFIDGSLYFANTANAHKRVDMTIRRSDDGGRSWPKSMVIQKDRSMGYSSLVQGIVPPGSSHGGILYESITSGAIDFLRFPLSLSPDAAVVYQ